MNTATLAEKIENLYYNSIIFWINFMSFSRPGGISSLESGFVTFNPALGKDILVRKETFTVYEVNGSIIPVDSSGLPDYFMKVLQTIDFPSAKNALEYLGRLDRPIFFQEHQKPLPPDTEPGSGSYRGLMLNLPQSMQNISPTSETEFYHENVIDDLILASIATSLKQQPKIAVIDSLNGYLASLISEINQGNVVAFNLMPQFEHMARYNIEEAVYQKQLNYPPVYEVVRKHNFNEILDKYENQFDILLFTVGVSEKTLFYFTSLLYKDKSSNILKDTAIRLDIHEPGIIIAPFTKKPEDIMHMQEKKQSLEEQFVQNVIYKYARTRYNRYKDIFFVNDDFRSFDYWISEDSGRSYNLLMPDVDVALFKIH